MYKRLLAAFLVLLLIWPATGVLATESDARHKAIISPEMELLAGVLTQTSWIEKRGPADGGSEYFRALKEHFSAYQDHEAIRLARSLTKGGFTYDAPAGFICHLGPLPDLELKYEYSEYLTKRSGGRKRLESFRIALADLAKTSHFLDFYNSWQPEMEKWIAAAGFNNDRLFDWLEDFFGTAASESHLILAPAMFPAGGYGAIVTGEAGEFISYQIIRAQAQAQEGRPVFHAGEDLEYLVLHEAGHSFVNPSLEAFPKQVKNLKALMKPVAADMKKQAYNDVQVFMNEQVLRAVTTLAAEELYGSATAAIWLKREEESSFYLTADVVEILRNYQRNRDTYPTFIEFVPQLLECMEGLTPPLSTWDRTWPVLIAVGSYLLFSFMRREPRDK